MGVCAWVCVFLCVYVCVAGRAANLYCLPGSGFVFWMRHSNYTELQLDGPERASCTTGGVEVCRQTDRQTTARAPQFYPVWTSWARSPNSRIPVTASTDSTFFLCLCLCSDVSCLSLQRSDTILRITAGERMGWGWGWWLGGGVLIGNSMPEMP